MKEEYVQELKDKFFAHWATSQIINGFIGSGKLLVSMGVPINIELLEKNIKSTNFKYEDVKNTLNSLPDQDTIISYRQEFEEYNEKELNDLKKILLDGSKITQEEFMERLIKQIENVGRSRKCW